MFEKIHIREIQYIKEVIHDSFVRSCGTKISYAKREDVINYMLKLIHRNPLFMDGYKEYCQEFWNNNIFWFRPTNPKNIDSNWFERTANWYAKKEKGLVPKYPKSFHYWAVDNGKFIGEFQLRPDLDDDLMIGIGSIGYSVRVSEWGKGYGKEILKQGLE